jgi:spermidine synthase
MITRYSSNFQEIIVEKTDDDLRLTLAWDLQFSSKEEHLYNEAMADYPMSILKDRDDLSVLILGGGDWLIAHELIQYRNISSITLCELDPKMIEICSTDTDIVAYNGDIFHNPKVHVVYEDAFVFVENLTETYDLIIADFPNPHIEVLSKLYSREFYANIYTHLKEDGIFVAQVAEVHHTKKCFQCVWKTLSTIFPYVRGYARYMQYTMGNLGFVIGSKNDSIHAIIVEQSIELDGKDVEINTVENNIAYHYFDEETKTSGFIPWITNNA